MGPLLLGFILAVTTTGTGSVDGWDLWDPYGWTATENDSLPSDAIGGIGDVQETPYPLSSTTDRLYPGGGDSGENSTKAASDYFPDVTSNGSFPEMSDGAPKEWDEASKGYAHKLFQNTIDFLSGIFSPAQTEEHNSTEETGDNPLCLDGNTLENCSSLDQHLEEYPPVTELGEEPDIDYPSPQDSDPSSSLPPATPATWIDASSVCFRHSIERSARNCDWEEGRTLEDSLLGIFNDTVIHRLAQKCVPGEWCLRMHFPKHQLLATKGSAGHLLSCLDEWGKDNSCQPSNLIWNVLYLLSSLTNATTSDVCVTSVLKVIHVTIADMIRATIQPEDEELLCSRDEDKEGCTGPCQKVGESLRCMATSCDNDTTLFESFPTWQWLLGKSDAVEKCPVNSSYCLLFETHLVATEHDTGIMPHHSSHRILKFLKSNEWTVVAGLTLSVLFSLLVVCAIFLGLRCSGRRRLRRRLMRQKAMVRDDEDGGRGGGGGVTRDRIQYTILSTQQDDFEDSDDDMT